MTEATSGSKVAFHYTGTLNDGSVFDSSEGRDPLSFTMGEGQIIPGLEAAFEGLKTGDAKTVTVPADQAYGDRDPNAMQQIPREQIPDNIPTEPGTQLQMQAPNGQAIPVVVAEVSETHITLDANHPLAGQDLTFAVEVVSVD
ncbi:FKBP-type peptidyl-prolyl cis-trans isomerase [Nioella ostreopsis]|jgi:peptidylprolyl isomerase|uniref:FKBP-type peptidyl-prolyl cis-trans isomerase n=1 Tax=Nioella ostreopsis TaxID=2448479 RepID=UPI000FDC0AD4|nr:peptidylprolyl isomerase [Nioella ostreopsis]